MVILVDLGAAPSGRALFLFVRWQDRRGPAICLCSSNGLGTSPD
jgi:hypothetical protein